MEPADLTIRPDVTEFAMMDFASMDALIAAGRGAGRAAVEEWIEESAPAMVAT